MAQPKPVSFSSPVSLQSSMAPKGVRANAVAPGSIRSPIRDKRWAKTKARPVGCVGEPDDVAATVLFLASGDAGFIKAAPLLVG
jgi:NAD(P)-dependent dehydrogenase (short-subunit alcohol dehydrogenase family)